MRFDILGGKMLSVLNNMRVKSRLIWHWRGIHSNVRFDIHIWMMMIIMIYYIVGLNLNRCGAFMVWMDFNGRSHLDMCTRHIFLMMSGDINVESMHRVVNNVINNVVDNNGMVDNMIYNMVNSDGVVNHVVHNMVDSDGVVNHVVNNVVNRDRVVNIVMSINRFSMVHVGDGRFSYMEWFAEYLWSSMEWFVEYL
jgi:hypothetical protein